MINIYEQSRSNKDVSFLLLMMLKMTSQIRWNFLDKSNSTFKRFIEILNQITKEEKETEEDKTKVYWEKALIDSWERLIDRAETRNFDFFVVKENLLTEKDIAVPSSQP